MAKPKFESNMLEGRSAAGGLKPLDFMRPMEVAEEKPLDVTTPPVVSQPASDTQSSTSASTSSAKPRKPAANRPQAAEHDLPMPPSRQTELKVQLNSRQLPELVERTKDFAAAHKAEVQDVIGLALDEYLTRRGG